MGGDAQLQVLAMGIRQTRIGRWRVDRAVVLSVLAHVLALLVLLAIGGGYV